VRWATAHGIAAKAKQVTREKRQHVKDMAVEADNVKAARALLATNKPLKQIAGEWGFANVNHFGKVFRRFLHASPAVYRRSLH